MLRRRVPAQSSFLAPTKLGCSCRFFFGGFGKKTETGEKKKEEVSSSGDAGAATGFPPGFDMQKLRTMQELFSNQPPEKQEQLMKQALEFQKTLGKIPGLGKFTQKNTEMMEQLAKMQKAAAAANPNSSASSTSSSPANSADAAQPFTGFPSARRKDLFKDVNKTPHSSGGKGPTLDELKKVNLGPEIEALFDELRIIRKKKNEYRDKYFSLQSAFTGVAKEKDALTTTEATLRRKLQESEKNLMLVNSENVELREKQSDMRQLAEKNKRLTQEIRQLREAAQSGSTPGSVPYEDLKVKLQGRDDAFRSMQRKVDRMRRRDPLLQFSLHCNSVSRLCELANKGETQGKDTTEETFAALQATFLAQQHAVWQVVASKGGAAAKAYAAAVRHYTGCCVPHANYDAVVVLAHSDAASVQKATSFFRDLGFSVEKDATTAEDGRLIVSAAVDADPMPHAPGPYGYAFALRERCTAASPRQAAALLTPAEKLGFAVTLVHPCVSTALLKNEKRCRVQYDTARASGPGGQATNVSETQINAKLEIDGEAAYSAESQDSRSALSNKEAALDRLHTQKRQQYNDQLAKKVRYESVQGDLVAAMKESSGFSVDEEVQQLVREAVQAAAVPVGDGVLVDMLLCLARRAGSSPESSS